MSIQEILNFIWEGLEVVFQYLQSTNKRTHYYYLISSLLLAFFVYHKKKNNKTSFFHYIFHKKIWCSTSAIIDYSFIVFNSFIKIIFIIPFLIYGLKFAFFITEILYTNLSEVTFKLSLKETMIYYTIALTIFSDFMTFLIHYLYHKIPFLWRFHKIHHSATSLNPFTQYRIHPVELIITNIVSIFTFGLVTGVFDYLSDQQISKWTFLGVNFLNFIFYTWGANLRHSHVKLKFHNLLEYLFISPVQHQVHHSENPIHFDKNLGSKLAIWDWIFGTLIRSEQIHKITFGLGKNDNPNYNSFLKNLTMPFKKKSK